MSPQEALDKAVSKIGSMQKLADILEVTKGAVSQWKDPDRRVPAEHCPIIERLTSGEVKCEELRPDVDWAYLRASHQEEIPCHRSSDKAHP
jgi:DNA-binding transcriptional regulator YdaS (Cro superfamily)